MKTASQFGLPFFCFGGDEGDRTPDLCNAIAALSQLSYVPKIKFRVSSSKFRVLKPEKNLNLSKTSERVKSIESIESIESVES